MELLGQSLEQCPFCPQVQQSTSLGSFLGLAEDDPTEDDSAGRGVPVAFIGVEPEGLCFAYCGAFSFPARRLVVGEEPLTSDVL